MIWILIISYIAVVNCNPQFLYHIINQQPYPYQYFGPPLIWFQGPPILHNPYPFGKIQGQISPKDQKKSPYSVDRTLYPKNETLQENSNENSTDSKDSKVICAYYDVLGEPCPVKDLSSPKPRGKECAKIPKWMKASMLTKIVKGQKALSPIPWQVRMCINRYKSYKLPFECPCGGTILDEKTILTAGHCKYTISDIPVHDYFIVAGVVSGSDSGQKSYVKKSFVHEDFEVNKYGKGYLYNDVAIFKLKTPLSFNDHVQPACLPDPESAPEITEEIAVTSGWGDLKQGSRKGSKILQYLSIPLIPSEKCVVPHTLYNPKEIDTSMVCAGYLEGKKDACAGDSGGPLVVPRSPEDDTAVIYGVVSWGLGCAQPKSPGVYARVTNFIEWIVSKMEDKK